MLSYFFPFGSDTCKERWLHVKHEEQEQMLMDKLCPPKALNWKSKSFYNIDSMVLHDV